MLSVLRNVTKEETVQYVLAMLVQMLAGAGTHFAGTGRIFAGPACTA
jgi:hypothetical protein